MDTHKHKMLANRLKHTIQIAKTNCHHVLPWSKHIYNPLTTRRTPFLASFFHVILYLLIRHIYKIYHSYALSIFLIIGINGLFKI